MNALASALMLFFLARGLDTQIPIEIRLHYIADHHVLWIGCWVAWILAALSLIFFLVNWGMLLNRLEAKTSRAWLAFGVLIGTLGMIPDTIAETLYISLIPKLALAAKQSLIDPPPNIVHEFELWQHCINMLTGFLGNGFYCIGGLTLAFVSLNSRAFPKKWALASLPIWLVGFGMSLAALVGNNIGLKATTAFTMIAFILWAGSLGIFFPDEPS